MPNSGGELLKVIKKEDDNAEGSRAQPNSGQRWSLRNPEPPPSIRCIGTVQLKHPSNYIIRKPTSSTSALKRIFVGRSASETKTESKEIDNSTIPHDRLFSTGARPLATSGPPVEAGRPVKYWRTPAGKLVKLDSRPALFPTIPRPSATPGPSLATNYTKTQPKFVRLSNGKIARISTKRVPVPFARRCRTTNMGEGQLSQFGLDAKRLDIPSATAKINASSEPIDIATLIGDGSATSKEAPLFEKNSGSAVVKVEPMDVDETPEQQEPKEQTPLERALTELAPEEVSSKERSQKFHEPLEPPPLCQPRPSLAAALEDVAANSQVGDLRKIREQPLFSQDSLRFSNKDSCNVCRAVVPGLKKNIISLEGRLTSLVDTVQNLITYLNPLDRKAAELAAMDSAPSSTEGSNTPDLSTVSTSSAARAYHFGDTSRDSSDRIPSLLLPVARRNESQIEMRTVAAEEVLNSMIHRPNVVRFLRNPSQSTAALESPSPPRSTHGRIRFVVADRAKSLRLGPNPSGSAADASSDKGEASNQKAEILIKVERLQCPCEYSYWVNPTCLEGSFQCKKAWRCQM
ncbi:hypothetical protein GCK32_001648 [Trichostrongylus colubriformis]|uniref:Uncharacterized protein n=1 Tax=Trichostrongylus colubriformis TaxID=6319 RepID=A0AAN8EVJ7_TRICO